MADMDPVRQGFKAREAEIEWACTTAKAGCRAALGKPGMETCSLEMYASFRRLPTLCLCLHDAARDCLVSPVASIFLRCYSTRRAQQTWSLLAPRQQHFLRQETAERQQERQQQRHAAVQDQASCLRL